MDIKQSMSGKILTVSSGYKAFVPASLPPKLDWSSRLINSLSRADQLIGQLAGEAGSFPNPHLLMRPFITYEAVTSSKIEGAQATLGEILANEAGVSVKSSSDDLQEINNYVIALDYALERLSTFPLSLRLLKEIHEKLMQGTRGFHATPGEFRKTQNWIGSPGCTLATAKYVPPPVEQMQSCLSDLEKFLHSQELPGLVHIALCHYQFEAIHPFLDGNGRVGRLLITLLLIERNLLPSPLLYLSAFFEATRDEYYRRLNAVSAENNWEEWLVYFLNGVAVLTEDVLIRAKNINKMIADWTLKASNTASSLPVELVQYLIVNPYITTNKVAEHFNVAFTTAKRAIAKLVDLEILHLVNNAKRDKVYCAKDILEVLTAEPKLSIELLNNSR